MEEVDFRHDKVFLSPHLRCWGYTTSCSLAIESPFYGDKAAGA